MAKLDGGIFSKPRGKTGGVVFGAARTRTGKVATVRQLVPPSNPNTTGQQAQRNIFRESLAIVRKIGKGIYGSDWNRAVSQLPGFQSMMSIFMNAMDTSFTLSLPPEINLGTLHFPDTFVVESGAAAGILNLDYSNEDGSNGTQNDVAVLIAIETNPGSSPDSRDVAVDTLQLRSETLASISGLTDGAEYLGACYFRGADSAAGLLSNAAWGIANAAT